MVLRKDVNGQWESCLGWGGIEGGLEEVQTSQGNNREILGKGG